MFIPPRPWTDARSANESVFRIIQWEYLLSSVAVLLWSTAVTVHNGNGWKTKQPVICKGLLGRIVSWSAVTGAPGAAAVLLMERVDMAEYGIEEKNR